MFFLGWYNFKIFDIGTTLLFSEILNNQLLDIKLELPRVVIQIDKSQQENLPEGGFPRICGLVRHLEQSAAAIEESSLDSNDEEDFPPPKRYKKKALRFSETVTFNYGQGPSERLLKLDYIYFHFFCLLGSLKQETLSQTFILNDEKKCPLNCILSQSDPIEACIRIASNNKMIIKKLLQNKKSSLKFDYMHKSYVIKEDTLLYFFKKFIEQLKTETQSNVKKDTGKIASALNLDTDMLELANDLNLQSDTKLHFWIKPVDTYKSRINEEGKLDLTKAILTTEKNKKDDLQDNVHRYHELFNINIGKLYATINNDIDKTFVKFEDVEALKCMMLITKEEKENVIKKIKR